jgi:hypothetical protein
MQRGKCTFPDYAGQANIEGREYLLSIFNTNAGSHTKDGVSSQHLGILAVRRKVLIG